MAFSSGDASFRTLRVWDVVGVYCVDAADDSGDNNLAPVFRTVLGLSLFAPFFAGKVDVSADVSVISGDVGRGNFARIYAARVVGQRSGTSVGDFGGSAVCRSDRFVTVAAAIRFDASGGVECGDCDALFFAVVPGDRLFSDAAAVPVARFFRHFSVRSAVSVDCQGTSEDFGTGRGSDYAPGADFNAVLGLAFLGNCGTVVDFGGRGVCAGGARFANGGLGRGGLVPC